MEEGKTRSRHETRHPDETLRMRYWNSTPVGNTSSLLVVQSNKFVIESPYIVMAVVVTAALLTEMVKIFDPYTICKKIKISLQVQCNMRYFKF